MESIKEIENRLANMSKDDLETNLDSYKDDTRKGVQNLVAKFRRALAKDKAELLRMEKLLMYERDLYGKGFSIIGGIDEVGRGPLAGPVVAACVVLEKNYIINGVNDSKKLSETKRNELYNIIKNEAMAIGIGIVDNKRIDEINILNATKEAMILAVNEIKLKMDCLLVDAVSIPNIKIPQRAIIKGDEKSLSIGAASIIAKVTRDKMMYEYSQIFEGYGFEANKGYGTKQHIDAIRENGLCAIHRRSFVGNFI